jgi:hypothetical protein
MRAALIHSMPCEIQILARLAHWRSQPPQDAEIRRGKTVIDYPLRSSAPSAVEFRAPRLR